MIRRIASTLAAVLLSACASTGGISPSSSPSITAPITIVVANRTNEAQSVYVAGENGRLGIVEMAQEHTFRLPASRYASGLKIELRGSASDERRVSDSIVASDGVTVVAADLTTISTYQRNR